MQASDESNGKTSSETTTEVNNKPNSDTQFRMRGESMNRIETFVAAALAFATTMLVISVGSIPETFQAFAIAVKNIPSFIASSAIIIWIWHSHADWSRRYGLEDKTTITVSSILICLVLVYIYPLRLMMQGMFYSLSGGYFPFEMELSTYDELRFLFVFYALGFTLISITFFSLYHHALKLKSQLDLNKYESFFTANYKAHWLARSIICLIVLIASVFTPDQIMFYTPYIYTLLFPISVFLSRRNKARWLALNQRPS